MNNLKIGVAQINIKSGDIEYNAIKVAKYIKEAQNKKIDLVIFPEFTLLGVAIGDAIKKFPILASNCKKWLKGLAQITTSTTAIVGFLEYRNKKYYNSVAILNNSKILKIIRQKSIDNKFDEYKYLSISPKNNNSINLKGENFKILIGSNYSKQVFNKNDIIICCSSITNSQDVYTPYSNNLTIFINQVGNIDNLTFEGKSSVFKNKQLIQTSKDFEEELMIYTGKNIVINNNTHKIFDLEYTDDLERTYKAAIQGIKDYFNKNNIKRAVLGLSGGLDSTVCAVLLAEALGKENVYGISMPSNITTIESKTDAEKLAKNLGINFTEMPIKEIVNITQKTSNELFNKIEKTWNCRNRISYTNDNIQARSRAIYLWSVSNEFSNCIPIATSDKSELYMGYATINGDMSGGYAPIADITKTKLFALAKWINKNHINKNIIPESIINKRPGAELAINHKTGKPLLAEEALMPYDFLDEIIWLIENEEVNYKDLLKHNFLYEKTNTVSKKQKKEWVQKFYNRMLSAGYKKSIMPPITNIDSKNNYKQSIISNHINYKDFSSKYIDKVLNESV